ncbi:MAG: GMC family oxidoreductase [Candidatus Hydrogenedentes bacterium]|nr:GMC family oxidoreductase [Candidatus Hydrogenedentota bacterium]
MSSQIHDCSARVPPETLTAKICIVGSGCGGATAAWRLAEAGHDVVVLEEGGDFAGRQLTQRESAMYDRLYMDRGARTTEDMAIAILQGRVLGGGGVINACDVVPPPDGVFEHWRSKFGLSDFEPARMKPYVERALQDLSANAILEHQVNRANLALQRGAQALGYRGAPMMHNRVGCAGLGTCLIGCPIDAKRNPRFVAIPRALEYGARFLTRARAVKIENATSVTKRVIVQTLDPNGYHEAAGFEVRADYVILAANAIASCQLLLRSGIGNPLVGRHVSLQPQLPLTAFFEEPLDAFYGIPQSYAVTEFEDEANVEHGLWGFRIEGIMGTPGIVSGTGMHTGARAKEVMARYRNMAAALLLAPDDADGTVHVSRAGRPLIRYTHKENHKARLRQAIREAARIYLAAGAKSVEASALPSISIASESQLTEVDAIDFAPATAALLSAHQQGGVRFGTSPKLGASNPDGNVYETNHVYVFDSSGFPSSASSHTMTPIITVSHCLSERLLARIA